MTEIEIYPIFPIPLGVVNLGRNFTDEELSFIKSLDLQLNSGNFISKNDYILEAEEMADLKEFCLTSINDYMQSIYQPSTDVSLRITQSWTNMTQQGGHHHKHSHINSIFSASFYIQTSGEDRIYFETPNRPMIQLESKEYTDLNSTSWWMPATQGSMVMFPSWLDHHVMTKDHEGDRISLSFNTFFVGEIGSRLKMCHLVLD